MYPLHYQESIIWYESIEMIQFGIETGPTMMTAMLTLEQSKRGIDTPTCNT